MASPAICHFCHSDTVRPVAGYRGLSRVTSDCKAWTPGGQFGICRMCGFPQTIVDDTWRMEIADIYGSYTTYFQGAGAEQSVFDSHTGKPALRSDLLLDRLLSHVPLKDTGALLDIGCGNGNFLRAFSRRQKSWVLDGSEWDEKYLAECRAIPSFRQLHTCPPKDIKGRYDVISIIHCLEHVPDPAELLAQVRDRLAPEGLLLVQVPDCAANPFMLTVADHCSHFSHPALAALVEACGFEVIHAVNTWISKEVTIVARNSRRPAILPARIDAILAQRLESFVRWLANTGEHARRVASAAGGKIGIFGTAIAGTWLHGELRGTARFFVDEDPNRRGRDYLGLPVYSPAELPRNSTVYVGLPPALAARLCERLQPVSAHWVVPPAI